MFFGFDGLTPSLLELKKIKVDLIPLLIREYERYLIKFFFRNLGQIKLVI